MVNSISNINYNIKFGSVTARSKAANYGTRRNIDMRMTKDGSILSRKYSKKTTGNSSTSAASATSAASTSSFTQLTNAMSLLNSLGTNSSSSASSSNTQAVQGSSGSSGISGTAKLQDNGSSFSGYAQNINNSSPAVDTNTIDSIESNLDQGGAWTKSALSGMKSTLSKEKTKMSQELASAQTDYSNILGQKLTAEANTAQLQTAVGTAEQERTTANTQLKNTESNLNSSLKTRDRLDEQLGSVNKEYNTDCEKVKTEENNKSKTQTEVSSAKESKAKADSAVTISSQSLQAAEETLASTPKTLADGKPNPQYETAKAAVEKAKTEKQNAEKAQTSAQTALENAQKSLDDTEQALSDAQEAKSSTLKNLQNTDSQYKDMAKKCEQMQNQVEQNQDAYDKSLENYDDTNANYERLNNELESQQGVLKQYEAIEAKLNEAKEMQSRINDLDTQLAQKLESLETPYTEEEKASVEKGIMENVNKSEGCSMNKTPLENMISCKDYDVTACTGTKWLTSQTETYGSASDFTRQGYIKNSDGSFTDPRTGVTMVNLSGDDYTWNRAGSGFDDSYATFANQDLVNRDYPEAVNALERSRTQRNVSLDGFNADGTPKFKWGGITRTSI